MSANFFVPSAAASGAKQMLAMTVRLRKMRMGVAFQIVLFLEKVAWQLWTKKAAILLVGAI
jgi:hypothetical protein